MFIQYGGNSAWSPQKLINIGELLGWYDATDSTTITESGGDVSQWDDKSGNGNNAVQSVGAEQPSTGTENINGHNAMDCSSDWFDLTSDITPNAVIWVCGGLNTSSILPIVGEEYVSSTTDFVFIRAATDPDYDISIDGVTGNSGNANVNGKDLVAGTNIALATTAEYNRGNNIWYCDYDSTPTVNLIARASISGSAWELVGSIGEVILLNNIPSEDTRQKLEGYLAHKWGLQYRLTGDHPYRTDGSLFGYNNLWNPSETTTELWLDFSDIGSISVSGTSISQADDKSGNGNHATQVTAGKQPAYTEGVNGLTVAGFDGSNDSLDTALTQLQTSTIFIVADPTARGNLLQNVIMGSASASGGGGLWWNVETYTDSDPSQDVKYTTDIDSSQIYYNGENQAMADFEPAIFCHEADAETTESLPYAIGKQNTTYTGSAFIYEGNIGEIIIFNSILSDNDRKRVEGYLAHKWSLTASLDSSHPYKTNPPVI